MSKNDDLILAGNWKLNPSTKKEAEKLATNIIKNAANTRGIDFVICPPHLYLASIKDGYRGKKVRFGAQDLYPEPNGAHTGQVSPTQLSDLGISHVILGHSELRAHLTNGGMGETDEIVNYKIKSALNHKLVPIVCIGEPVRDADGSHLKFIKDQIKNTFSGLSASQMLSLVVAYEPVWAIGGKAKKAITGHELHQVALYIRKVLIEIWNIKTANSVKILYGGSVKSTNAYELTKEGNMDGFLVGGASLDAEGFVGIAQEMKRALKDSK